MERLAVMGLVEPLKRLPELLRIRRQLIAQQLKWQPDLFLGVDSPDFNLPVERRLRADRHYNGSFGEPFGLGMAKWAHSEYPSIRR